VKFAWSDEGEKQVHRDSSQDYDSERLWTVFSNSFEKSYASTTDFPNYQTLSFQAFDSSKVLKSRSTYNPNVFTVSSEDIGNDPRTTIMIRNIPNKYTIDDLSREINF
jgi:hypothetical protein